MYVSGATAVITHRLTPPFLLEGVKTVINDVETMRLAVVGRVRARVCFSRLMDESERSRSRAGAHVGPGSVLGQGRVGDNGTSPAAPRRRQTGLPDKEAIDRRAVRNHSFAQSVVSDTPTHAVFAYARVRVTLRDKCLSDNTNKKSQPFIYKRNECTKFQ